MKRQLFLFQVFYYQGILGRRALKEAGIRTVCSAIKRLLDYRKVCLKVFPQCLCFFL